MRLLFYTLIYLKPIQIYYRVYYFFKKNIFAQSVKKKLCKNRCEIKWKSSLGYKNCYDHLTKSFTFLNITHTFTHKIDWNINRYGKLWVYNLNYFDYLVQNDLTKEEGLELIKDFIDNDAFIKDGKEPYPTSLRGINWVKFLSKHQINNNDINSSLYQQYYFLFKNLEYHLLGNHLLENAFSLLFGAYFFQDEELYVKAKNTLLDELNEQVLEDGAHFELSPMYHQIILTRLLDCINLIKLNTWKNDDFILFIINKAELMVSWLDKITYKNGHIPMVNDATFGIAPSTKKLIAYAKHLGIINKNIKLSDSGYRKINHSNYEMFIDVGNIKAPYQPGHTHSDIFNFELVKNNIPIFVDTGISTYEKNLKRQRERSTSSHNTVVIGNNDQTEVWGGFRVARRAEIIHLIEKTNFIEASHNGYQKMGYNHTRSFEFEQDSIILLDKIDKTTRNNAKAFFHLHSSVGKPIVDGSFIKLSANDISIKFENASNIDIEEYDLSAGFNKSNLAYKIIVKFNQVLKTKISI